MNGSPNYAVLLRNTLAALAVCVLFVAFCYYFVDRRVAFFVHNSGLSDYAFLKWLTYPPPVVQAFSPAVLAVLMVRRALGPFRRWERAAVAACVAIVLADQFRESLEYVFGRAWPETWTHDNPSLIGDGVYGFHFLRGGPDYGSFPSGHAARTLAAAALVWIAWPGWRWAAVLVSAAVAAGLIGMNYHFVGDVIAGGFLGGIVGAYAAAFGGLGSGAGPDATQEAAVKPAG